MVITTSGGLGTNQSSHANENQSTFKHVHSTDIESVQNQLKVDGKKVVTSSNTSFLTTAIIGVPAFLTLLPLTVAYQTGKSLFSNSEKSSHKVVDDPLIASSEESIGEKFPSLDEIKPKTERKYDIVLLGCTGFTGRLAAIYIAKTYRINQSVKWAIAGRSQAKLSKLKNELNKYVSNASETLDTIIVDTTDPSTMHDLVQNTKCVVTTAGPFWKYGSKVVEFCVKYGTDYVDTTGETGWNKEMIMKWNNLAVKTGSKIISLCGMDSIPWDLSFYKLSQLVKKGSNGDGDYLVKVKFFDEMKGGISGGTIDTMISIAIDQNYKEKKYDCDPYCQGIHGDKISHKLKDVSPALPQRSLRADGRWTIPWLMGMVNSEVVKRSNVLLTDQIATKHNATPRTNVKYEEYWVQQTFKEAFVTWFGTVITATALLNPLIGTPVKKYLLPKPGQGPDDVALKKGYLLLNAIGESKNGTRVESSMYFPNDPGYADTARMVTESGLCLALDSDKLPVQEGGFYTPAIGMGDALMERLCATGCKFASRIISTLDDGKLSSKL